MPSPASHWPNIAEQADGIRDFLRETFAGWFAARKDSASLDEKACFDLIDQAIATQAESDEFDARSVGATESPASLIAVLRQVYTTEPDRHIRMRVFCHLRLLNADERTFQEVANELGFKTRATPSKEYRKIQRALGDLPARGDKSPAAREKYRQIRTGARRERKPWPGLSLWNSLSSPSAQAVAA